MYFIREQWSRTLDLESLVQCGLSLKRLILKGHTVVWTRKYMLIHGGRDSEHFGVDFSNGTLAFDSCGMTLMWCFLTVAMTDLRLELDTLTRRKHGRPISSLTCFQLEIEDVYGGNNNNGFSTKKKQKQQWLLRWLLSSSVSVLPHICYDMMNYASGKTTNTTPQYSYLGRSDSRMYSMYGPYMTGYGHYNTYTPNWYVFNNGYKTKSYGFYGFSKTFLVGKENEEWLNELNRGPRAKGFNIGQPETIKATEDVSLLLPDSKEYIKKDFFSNTYTNAKLFVIKSYSEMIFTKASNITCGPAPLMATRSLTLRRTKQLETSPPALFFSSSLRTFGCFPVKWHIVKYIPNSSLRHITLENNENKPVTNSRDTQEVKESSDQVVKVIKIFKEHVSKTCILDDLVFYESREKIIKEGKSNTSYIKNSDKKATPKDESKETNVIAELAEEISQNGVAEVASAC
ncbi:hypothetical protein Bca52824_017566 [Brassica carinata]|uniref:YTH domain-containing family protein n=1 Tax=Brassica carinata TaxID=52824 RepID=A0A8X7VMU4_BRACI|nr:hypothetical protein Bca52824_017566 [Brassica carinata]